MSIKTTRFKRKAAQFRTKNPGGEATKILPFSRVKGPGRKTVFAVADMIDEAGRKVRAGTRGRPRPSNLVCTEPMGEKKVQRYLKLVK